MRDGEVVFQGYTEKELPNEASETSSVSSEDRDYSSYFNCFQERELEECVKACAADTNLSVDWGVMDEKLMFKGRTERKLLTAASKTSASFEKCKENFHSFFKQAQWVEINDQALTACIKGITSKSSDGYKLWFDLASEGVSFTNPDEDGLIKSHALLERVKACYSHLEGLRKMKSV